ncbi:hypothetical protein NDU88_007348 [Pleurodeles waltl]|uniref:60S ribosomal protein L14 n=1 Tax=Pleurodeles waltl TaxID=8319 RepID=A0AAV7RUJ8_PLEWA|nr:hypothetical protein NDU88_007348 [Pleurodeles waltl]
MEAPDLQKSDKLVIKNRHPGGKFCTSFEREVLTVVQVQGTMVNVRQNDQEVKRNVYWFKKINRGEDMVIDESKSPAGEEVLDTATETAAAKRSRGRQGQRVPRLELRRRATLLVERMLKEELRFE